MAPIDPWGLGQQLYDRIRERVQNEIGVQPVQPTSAEPGAPGAPPDFMSRIKQLVKQQLGYGQPPGPPAPPGAPPAAPEYQGPPRGLAEIKQRIQEAGRQQPPKLLKLLYNNQWRDVEVYSYRFRDADDPHIPLLYAFDVTKDNQIEAYKLKKIQDLQVTGRPYQPRWVVEF
jgi:hypothetical protein